MHDVLLGGLSICLPELRRIEQRSIRRSDIRNCRRPRSDRFSRSACCTVINRPPSPSFRFARRRSTELSLRRRPRLRTRPKQTSHRRAEKKLRSIKIAVFLCHRHNSLPDAAPCRERAPLNACPRVCPIKSAAFRRSRSLLLLQIRLVVSPRLFFRWPSGSRVESRWGQKEGP